MAWCENLRIKTLRIIDTHGKGSASEKATNLSGIDRIASRQTPVLVAPSSRSVATEIRFVLSFAK